MTNIQFAKKALEAISKSYPIHRWFVALDPVFHPAIVCEIDGKQVAYIEYDGDRLFSKLKNPDRIFRDRPFSAVVELIKEVDSLV